MRYNMIDRHHLLECILWPNGDGTFRKIVNTQKRLEELGVYDEWKLVIPIEHNAHSTMHHKFKKGTEYERSGEKAPMYGRTGEKAPMYGRSGEKAPMYGKGYLIAGEKNGMYGRDVSREKSPTWKGDKAGPSGIYMRALKLYKSGQITDEEFQPFRDIWNEYKRLKRQRKNVS